LLKAHLPPANDRMVTTLLLAALLHGIVILGVTFSSPDGDATAIEAPALEVVLVNDRRRASKATRRRAISRSATRRAPATR
jgi:hypothetical protein